MDIYEIIYDRDNNFKPPTTNDDLYYGLDTIWAQFNQLDAQSKVYAMRWSRQAQELLKEMDQWEHQRFYV
jgi:hypothetical protein